MDNSNLSTQTKRSNPNLNYCTHQNHQVNWQFGFNHVDNIIITMDIGQGDCTYVKLGDFSMLIDGGRETEGQQALTRLANSGATPLNMVICTHSDSDHRGGLKKLAKPLINQHTLYATSDPYLKDKDSGLFNHYRVLPDYQKHPSGNTQPGNFYLLYAQGQNIDFTNVQNDLTALSKINRWVILLCKHEQKEGTYPNDFSPIIIIRCNTHYHVVCGDLKVDKRHAVQILDVINKTRSSQDDTLSLLLPHHGSAYSIDEEFVKTLREGMGNSKPAFMLSCNSWEYRHPHEQTLRLVSGEIFDATDPQSQRHKGNRTELDKQNAAKIYCTNLYNIKLDGNKLGSVRICGTQEIYGDIPLVFTEFGPLVQYWAIPKSFQSTPTYTDKNTENWLKGTGVIPLYDYPFGVEARVRAQHKTGTQITSCFEPMQLPSAGQQHQNSFPYTRTGEMLVGGFIYPVQKRETAITFSISEPDNNPLKSFYNSYGLTKQQASNQKFGTLISQSPLMDLLDKPIKRVKKTSSSHALTDPIEQFYLDFSSAVNVTSPSGRQSRSTVKLTYTGHLDFKTAKTILFSKEGSQALTQCMIQGIEARYALDADAELIFEDALFGFSKEFKVHICNLLRFSAVKKAHETYQSGTFTNQECNIHCSEDLAIDEEIIGQLGQKKLDKLVTEALNTAWQKFV